MSDLKKIFIVLIICAGIWVLIASADLLFFRKTDDIIASGTMQYQFANKICGLTCPGNIDNFDQVGFKIIKNKVEFRCAEAFRWSIVPIAKKVIIKEKVEKIKDIILGGDHD